jgi:hypothetical protein
LNDAYNLKKHPELFYLTDNSFHVCPECFERWACETIQNYKTCDHSEFIEVCYKCKKQNFKQKDLGKLPEFIAKQLIKTHEEAKAYARSLGSVC